MGLSYKIFETVGKSVLDKGYVDADGYSMVKDLYIEQEEAHTKAKEVGIEDRYLPSDISLEDFLNDINKEYENRGGKSCETK